MTEMERAIQAALDNNPKSPALVDVCQYLAGDSACYQAETGDQSDFGRWACLIEFDKDEAESLLVAGIIGYDAMNQDGSLTVTYHTTDWSRDADIGREGFDSIDKAYTEFCKPDDHCDVCGDERYADDAFCGGNSCDNDKTHEHDNTRMGVCQGCITHANAEAQLS